MINTESHPTKYLVNSLQKYQGHKRQGKTKGIATDGRDKREMKTKCNVGSCARKSTLVEKTSEIRRKFVMYLLVLDQC